MPSEHYRRTNPHRGKGAGNAQKTGACRNCGKEGHWARECRQQKGDHANSTADWTSATIDFVRASGCNGLEYKPERWLVDSASTCMVVNEAFPEFFNLRDADINIRVGGGNDLPCSMIGDIWIKGAAKPMLLVGVRIVPGFGVNILSGPYLEQNLGMTLSSNGRTWSATDQGGNVMIHGPADGAGLYWCKLHRLQPTGKRKMRNRNKRSSSARTDDNTRHHSQKRLAGNVSAPFENGRSPMIGFAVRGEQVRDERGISGLSLTTREERSELSYHSDSSELSEERDNNHSSSSSPLTNTFSLSDLTLVTRQQSADLLAAHLRWGHRSFRRCAQILGIPSTSKSPFCVACVEAKASRHPRRGRGVQTSLLREPATRPGFRLFFDPIGPFRVPTLSRFRHALVVMDDYSGLVHLRLMVRLNEWFSHLTALIRRIEAEKGSERVVAQIGSDSFPAFVKGTQILELAASRGILLTLHPEVEPCRGHH